MICLRSFRFLPIDSSVYLWANIHPVSNGGFFLLVIQPSGGAHSGIGCLLGIAAMPSGSAVPCNWSDHRPCRLRPDAPASSDQSGAASEAPSHGSVGNGCSPWSIGLKSVCSLLLPKPKEEHPRCIQSIPPAWRRNLKQTPEKVFSSGAIGGCGDYVPF